MTISKSPNKNVFNVVIALGQTESIDVELKQFTPAAIQMPVTTGTAFTFEVSADSGTTYATLVDVVGVAITVFKTAATTSMHTLNANELAGFTNLKMVSNLVEAAERTIGIVTLEI